MPASREELRLFIHGKGKKKKTIITITMTKMTMTIKRTIPKYDNKKYEEFKKIIRITNKQKLKTIFT